LIGAASRTQVGSRNALSVAMAYTPQQTASQHPANYSVKLTSDVARHLRFGDPKNRDTWAAEVDVQWLIDNNYSLFCERRAIAGSRDLTQYKTAEAQHGTKPL